ncbi:inter-alpha-trypsin inhibitor heavy chain H3-like [Dysidea avara]|uniref:inter-alpha-trypsin inhibitor heavy chain H3-like n=1 Tax=Dysidea avara TaxID=196820 RepID=UPI0033292D77
MMISKLLGITVLGVYSLYLGVTAQTCYETTSNCASGDESTRTFSNAPGCCDKRLSYADDENQCISCPMGGCFGDTSCVDVIDGTSLTTADCCKAGGVAILQRFVLCTALDCPAKQCYLSESCDEGGMTVQAASTTECCEKGGKYFSNGFECLPACGMIEGDPHFIIPLLSKEFLCYSIQGYSGLAFNLIYNDAFTINAMFVNTEGDTSEATWIGKLAVIPRNSHRSNAVVFDSVKQAVTIVGDGSLNAATIKHIAFTENGMAKFSKTMKKQTGNPIIRVMYAKPQAKFDVTFYKDHLNVDWSLNYDELHDSHGLMGQFMKKGINIDTKREMLIFSNGRDPVPVARDSVMTGKWCWKSKNYGNQGEGLIEGNVLDYLVPNILDVADKLKHLTSK